jgi:hypothetical protein
MDSLLSIPAGLPRPEEFSEPLVQCGDVIRHLRVRGSIRRETNGLLSSRVTRVWLSVTALYSTCRPAIGRSSPLTAGIASTRHLQNLPVSGLHSISHHHLYEDS